MPSFDIVPQVNSIEIEKAINQAKEGLAIDVRRMNNFLVAVRQLISEINLFITS